MKIIDELKERGMLSNITNEDKFNKLTKGSGVYIGFDPTAQSLHIGNYIQILMLKRFEKAGFKPYALVGGATGMIGDPSGKSEERNLLDQNTLQKNKIKIIKQLKFFGLEVIDNYDFYKDKNIIEFLRDTGKLLNIAYMMNKDIVKNRIDFGLSFTEFSYQLIQGWDFYKLYSEHGIKVQVGGSDQWGNITAGTEIIRKKVGDQYDAIGITTELLTTSSGQKFGKSEGNALFIDKKLTSSFQIHQYILNTPDKDVEKLLNWITLLPIKSIKNIMLKHYENPKYRYAQNVLANTIISEIYGANELELITTIENVLFGGKKVSSLNFKEVMSLSDAIPTINSEETNLLSLLVKAGAANSKREAREFILNNAIEVNGEIINDINYSIDKKNFNGKATIIRRGKRNFFLIKH